MRFRFFLAIVLCLASAPHAALAWNYTGHMTVALLAYRRLNDQQRQRVGEILRQHPHYKLFLINDLPPNVDETEWAFLRASTWPDFVRPSRPGTPDEIFKGPEITRYHQGNWHYIDIAWVPPRERDRINATTLPARQEPNALTALDDASKKLSSAETSPADKAVALCWLEHLTGDIHQPLHACRVYSAQYPQGDKGGNDEAIRSNGAPIRLHSYWDDALGMSDAYLAVAFVADEIAASPQCDVAKLPELAKDAPFSTWAEESYQYAIAFAHLNGRLKSAPYADFESKKITAEEVPAVSASYAGNTREVAKRRVAVAGYRLAGEIAKVLGQ